MTRGLQGGRVLAMASAVLLGATAVEAGKEAVTDVTVVFGVLGGSTGASGGTGSGVEPGAAETGARVAGQIEQVNNLCRDLSQEAYAIDCVAAGLEEIVASMAKTGAEAEARAALEKAARELRELAEANRDTTLPRANIRRGSVTSPRPVVPVVRSAEVTAAAEAIIAGAQTVLLRSSSPAATPVNAAVSDALDTTRVLLRSS